MSRIKRLVRPETQASNWKAAVPALVLAVASLAGCAQTALTGQGPAGPAASSTATSAVADFASCARPEYPMRALRDGVTGTVTLNYLVGTDGIVRDSNVKKSSGDVSLDEAARLAIGKCRFSPATADGRPVQAWVPVQYVWTLSK